MLTGYVHTSHPRTNMLTFAQALCRCGAVPIESRNRCEPGRLAPCALLHAVGTVAICVRFPRSIDDAHRLGGGPQAGALNPDNGTRNLYQVQLC